MMQVLAQNVLSYRKTLYAAGVLRNACCSFVISGDNKMITVWRWGAISAALSYPVKIYLDQQLNYHDFFIMIYMKREYGLSKVRG